MPILKRILLYLRCFYDAAVNTVNHDGIEHAGYMAFLSMLSLFPFLVLMVAIAGGLIGNPAIGEEFVALVFSHLPENAIQAITPRIEEIVSGPPQGLLTISILGAIWTASSSVEGLRTILNRAYRVSTPPAYPLRRLLSIVQMLVATLIIIALMLGLIFIPILYHAIMQWVPLPIDLSLTTVSIFLAGFALWMVVAFIYYILPNIKQSFVRALPGALITVLLWMQAASIFSYYLSQVDQVNLIYGSLGGVIAALLFFYIFSVIIIYGAELNYLLEKAAGHTIEEKEHVEPSQNGNGAD